MGPATGRTERTVRTMLDFDSLNRSHPLNVLPLHNSHVVPGLIRMLYTLKGVIFVVGRVRVKP